MGLCDLLFETNWDDDAELFFGLAEGLDGCL